MDGQDRRQVAEGNLSGASLPWQATRNKMQDAFCFNNKKPLGFWQSHPCLPLILAPSIGIRSAAHFI